MSEGSARGQRSPTRKSPDSTVLLFTGDSRRDRYAVEKLLEELAEISKRAANVRGEDDLRELLSHVVDVSVRRTKSERGLLVLEEGGALRADVARGPDGRDLPGEPTFSTSAVRKVLESGEPRMDDFRTADDESTDLGQSVVELELRWLMCVPFVVGGSERSEPVRGVLYVDSKHRSFDERTLGYFTVLSQQIATVLEIARLHVDSLERLRLEQSLELASAIQKCFLSRVPDAVPGLDAHGWYEPAEQTSGDFFSLTRTRDGALAAVVGDAAGHGIGPALVASSVHGSLRALLQVEEDPGLALAALDRDLAGRLEEGFFITLCLARIDGDGRVRVVGAGHPEPLLWKRASGDVVRVRAVAPALGMIPGCEYAESEPQRLEPGDALVLYSDGLIEARPTPDAQELFGISRLADALAACAPRVRSAAELTHDLAGVVRGFSDGRIDDDRTIVAVRRTG